MEKKSFHHGGRSQDGTIFSPWRNDLLSGIFSLNHRQAEREMWRMQEKAKNRSETKEAFFPSKTSRHPFSFVYFCHFVFLQI